MERNESCGNMSAQLTEIKNAGFCNFTLNGLLSAPVYDPTAGNNRSRESLQVEIAL